MKSIVIQNPTKNQKVQWSITTYLPTKYQLSFLKVKLNFDFELFQILILIFIDLATVICLKF